MHFIHFLSLFEVSLCVPQGSVLGALNIRVFVNDLCIVSNCILDTYYSLIILEFFML
jgi:hypothetical protein